MRLPRFVWNFCFDRGRKERKKVFVSVHSMKKCDQRGCTKQNRILSHRCAVGLSADISTASAPAYPRLGGVPFSMIIIPWLPCEVVNGF